MKTLFFLLLLGQAALAEEPKNVFSSSSVAQTLRMNDITGPTALVMNVGKATVTIKADGTIIYGEGYTPDEAGRLFWEAVGRSMPMCKVK